MTPTIIPPPSPSQAPPGTDELDYLRAAAELDAARLARAAQHIRLLQAQLIRHGIIPEVIG